MVLPPVVGAFLSVEVANYGRGHAPQPVEFKNLLGDKIVLVDATELFAEHV